MPLGSEYETFQPSASGRALIRADLPEAELRPVDEAELEPELGSMRGKGTTSPQIDLVANDREKSPAGVSSALTAVLTCHCQAPLPSFIL